MRSSFTPKQESRDFPQISFNKHKQQSQDSRLQSLHLRTNINDTKLSNNQQLNTNNNNKNKFSVLPTVRSFSEAQKSNKEVQRASSIMSNTINYSNTNSKAKIHSKPIIPYQYTLENRQIQSAKSKNDYVGFKNDYDGIPEFINTVMKSKDPSFIDCDNQLKIVGSSEKNEFPLMNSLLYQNKELLQQSMSQIKQFQDYEIVNPEVKRIIEEFRIEQERNKNTPMIEKQTLTQVELHEPLQPLKLSTTSPKQLFGHQSYGQQYGISEQKDVPSSPTYKGLQNSQGPLLKDRQGLYQYMRDCQKIQKCQSDQSVKMTEMSLKLPHDKNFSPLNYDNNYFNLKSLEDNDKLEFSYDSIREKSIKIYESITEQPQQLTQRTRNSVNTSVKQYGTKKTRSQWGKENKSQQNVKPQIKQNFQQRLERDVTRRQSKIKQTVPIKFKDSNFQEGSQKRNSVKVQTNQPLNKVSVLEAIDQLGRRSHDHKKDPILINNLKQTVTWLFDQIEAKNPRQNDNQFLQQLEQLDQFKMFLNEF